MSELEQILKEVKAMSRTIDGVRDRVAVIAKTISVETEWMTVVDAAKKIGCQNKHIYTLCCNGKLESRPKGKFRIKRESVENYLNS